MAVMSHQVAHQDIYDVIVDQHRHYTDDYYSRQCVIVTGKIALLYFFQQVRGEPMIRGIKFVNVPVKNQDDAVKFYTEKLGFRVLTDQPFDGKQRWIEIGIPGADSKLVLFTTDGDKNRIGSHQPVTFWSDVEATSRLLKSKGVSFVMEPKTEAWGTAAIFKDQDGNQFVLSSK